MAMISWKEEVADYVWVRGASEDGLSLPAGKCILH